MTTTIQNGARKPLISPAEVAEKTAHYEREVRVPIQKFHRIIIDENWTLAQAAERVPHGPHGTPLSTGLLSQLFSGQYASPKAAAQSIQRAVNLHSERKLLDEIGFVETRLSKEIFKFCKWAHLNKRVARIYGRTHDGKTTALKAFPLTYKSGVPLYWRLPSSASYLVAVLELCKALGYPDLKSNRAAREAIFGTISEAHLIIVDEAHLPFTTYAHGQGKKLIELLREIHDVCNCGIVFCGTQSLRENIQGGADAILFRQIVQRSPICLDTTPHGNMKAFLPGYGAGGKEDVLKIAAAFGLGEPDQETYDLIKRIVKDESTGRLFHLLTAARNRSKATSTVIDWYHFHQTVEDINAYA